MVFLLMLRRSHLRSGILTIDRRQVEVVFPAGIDPIEYSCHPQRGILRHPTVDPDLKRSAMGPYVEVLSQIPGYPLAGPAGTLTLTAQTDERRLRRLDG